MTDILFLQETLLPKDNSDKLEIINTECNGIQVSSMRKSIKLYGRSSVGLAILWKNTNIKYFTVHGNNRFIGLKLLIGEIGYLMLNVYLNCDYHTIECFIEYNEN